MGPAVGRGGGRLTSQLYPNCCGRGVNQEVAGGGGLIRRPIQVVGADGGRASHRKELWVVGQQALPPNEVGWHIRGQWPEGGTIGGWLAFPALDWIRGAYWG